MIYLFLPPLALIATTIVISVLPLLKFVDISAELSEDDGTHPVIDYVVIMLILYYCFVAALIRDNQKICELKISRLKTGINKMRKSKYGEDTSTEMEKLYKMQDFVKYIKNSKEMETRK